jgi:pimeloyl-ACP methyl ester carboxylesterase
LTPEAWRRGGDSFRWRDHEIFVREEGAGPWLLLVHGFPTASWDWHRIWPQLAPRFRVLALDLLGYGFSDKPVRHDYATADQASLVERLLIRKKVDSVSVVAHDYGDTVVQELLARQREGRSATRISAVCFLNGGLFFEAIRPRPIQRLLLSPLGPALARTYSRRSFDRSISAVFGPRNQPSRTDLDALWSLLRHNGGNRIAHRLIRYLPERQKYRERWGDAVSGAGVPLRLIAGMEDPVSGSEMVSRYRQIVPAADVVELEGIGHFPQLESPAAVIAAVLEFLRGIGHAC